MCRIATILILVIIIISCKKETNYLQPLISHPWEETGIFDTLPGTGLKQYYSIQFFENNEVEIVIDFGGVSGVPDPVVLDTILSKYRLDDNVIVFPESIATFIMLSPSDTVLVYINSWEIRSIDENQLVIMPVEDYQPPDSDFGKFIIGGFGEITFKPLD